MTDDLMVLINKAAEALKSFGATEVYLFGSVATGTNTKDSDIDLAVAGLPPESFFEAMGRAEDILNDEIDLIDLDEQNPFTNYLKMKGNMLRVA